MHFANNDHRISGSDNANEGNFSNVSCRAPQLRRKQFNQSNRGGRTSQGLSRSNSMFPEFPSWEDYMHDYNASFERSGEEGGLFSEYVLNGAAIIVCGYVGRQAREKEEQRSKAVRHLEGRPAQQNNTQKGRRPGNDNVESPYNIHEPEWMRDRAISESTGFHFDDPRMNRPNRVEDEDVEQRFQQVYFGMVDGQEVELSPSPLPEVVSVEDVHGAVHDVHFLGRSASIILNPENLQLMHRQMGNQQLQLAERHDTHQMDEFSDIQAHQEIASPLPCLSIVLYQNVANERALVAYDNENNADQQDGVFYVNTASVVDNESHIYDEIYDAPWEQQLRIYRGQMEFPRQRFSDNNSGNIELQTGLAPPPFYSPFASHPIRSIPIPAGHGNRKPMNGTWTTQDSSERSGRHSTTHQQQNGLCQKIINYFWRRN